MTQREVKRNFNRLYKHDLMTKHTKDRIAWREAFSCYIDTLCKDGDITQKQYDAIEYPKWMAEKKRY